MQILCTAQVEGRRSWMLEVTNIHKAFGKQEVLKGVDITVEKGDVVTVLGPSGSG
jgi:L-cystine transport system ATP-binding protein